MASTESTEQSRAASAGERFASSSDRVFLDGGAPVITPSPMEVSEGVAAEVDESEFDSIEEVDAVSRGLRRIAIEYGLLVVLCLMVVPILSFVAPWWFARRVWGGFTLNFLTVAVLLHVLFVGVAAAYTRLANRSEDEMLGRPRSEGDWQDV